MSKIEIDEKHLKDLLIWQKQVITSLTESVQRLTLSLNDFTEGLRETRDSIDGNEIHKVSLDEVRLMRSNIGKGKDEDYHA